jgi:hypothetical protein
VVKLGTKTPQGRWARRIKDVGAITGVDYDSTGLTIEVEGAMLLLSRAEAQALADRLRRALRFQSTEWGLPAPVDAAVAYIDGTGSDV